MDGLRVGITAGRQGHVLAAGLARRGAVVLRGATVAGDQAAHDASHAVDRLLAERPQWIVASTGMAVRMAAESAEASGRADEFRGLLGQARVVARGAKAHGALRALGADPVFVSPQETDRDTAAWVARHVLPGDRVAILAHGGPAERGKDPYEPVVRAGAATMLVHPYRSAPPEDTAPARALIETACAGDLDAVVCTSPNAVRNLFAIAEEAGHLEELLRALRERVAATVIGPVTANAMESAGAPVTVMPLRARTADLVRALDAWAARGGRLAPGVLRLAPETLAVRHPGGTLRLGDREFSLLASLVRRPEVVCPPGVLALEVWGHAAPGDVLSVKHLVSRVRRKLGEQGAVVETVRSVGYRYAPYAVRAR